MSGTPAAAPSKAPSAAPASLPLPKVLQFMKQQTQLLKFGVTGTPKFTGFQLSNDMSFISWVSAKKDTSHAKVMIKNIVELTFGQRTDKFKRNPRPDLMHLSFSLSHRLEDHPGETDTLDIVCKDEKELQYWTTGLLALIEGRVTLEVIAAVADLPPLAAPTNDEAKSAFQGTNDVFSFGCGSWGQHGLTELHDERSPTIVKSFLGRGVQLIACGWAHSVVMLETGQLAAYGDRVGTGLEKDSLLPTIIQLPPASRATITQIACGAFHSALVTDRGELLTWGCNLNGQLGLGHNFDVATPTALPASAFGDNSVQAVYCGANTTAAVSANGDLYTWGAGESGALGHNDKQDRWSPVPVQDLVGQRIAKVACGEAHMIAYSDDKETFSWGWNACGQLGLGHCDDVLRPSPIEVFRGQEVLELAAGAAHSVALVMIPKMNIRQAFVFGANNCGQLGLPEKKSHSKPSVVPPVSTEEISTIACGAHHTVLHSSASGEVFTAGSNESGQLGQTSEALSVESLNFAMVETLRGRLVRSIACGGQHTSALVARAFIEDSDANECMGCRERFTLLVRRHHCRHCGGVFCSKCTGKTLALLKYLIADPVRVCNGCYAKLTN